MDIKTLVSATAIVLAATIGSAFAADQFTTLDGVTAKQMTSGDLANVKGQFAHFTVNGLPINPVDHPFVLGGPLGASGHPGFKGITVAGSNGAAVAPG